MYDEKDPQTVFRAELIKLTLELHVAAAGLRDVDARVSDDFLRELRRLRREIDVAPGSELAGLADELDDLLRAVAIEVIVKILGTSAYQSCPHLFCGKSIDEYRNSYPYVARVCWAEAA
jgi:hypothetical protein